MHGFRLTILRAALATGAFIALWGIVTLTFGGIGVVDLIGWALLYFVGLAWVEYLVEQAACRIESRRVMAELATGADAGLPNVAASGEALPVRRGWNPFDPAAWYYRFWVSLAGFLLFSLAALAYVACSLGLLGPRAAAAMTMALKAGAVAAGTLAMSALAAAVAQSQRLRQSLAMLATYSVLFVAAYLLIHWNWGKKGNEKDYDLPAGGGADSIKASTVKVQKVVRKKFVINKFSSIIFNAPPPIEQIDVKLDAETANQYKAGQGDGGLGRGAGKGGGFGSGTGMGKYLFVRLKHSDGNWNKNLGIGGDYNLLLRLKEAEPLVKIAEESSSIDYEGVDIISAKKPLPLLYIGGAKGFAPSARDKKRLKIYLTDKHGMILGDNLGGQGFHNAFVAVMNEITGVNPVPIPRDDRIHQRPYPLPQLPIVVAHGGTVPLGWKIDGRWAVYYHPGALSDAWADDHAGIPKSIWELCYQLGINILYYAYAEQDTWRESQKP